MIDDYFEIDWEKVLSELKVINARTLLVELPEGLKQFIPEIDKRLGGYTVYYSGENVYGACDTNNFNFDVDVVLHFGHAPIPNLKYARKTIFIELKRKLKMSSELINSIKSLNCKKIGILATVQYIPLLNIIKETLGKSADVIIAKGDERLFYDGQVLGCDFSAAERISENVDCFIVIADGTFHAGGIALSTGKETYAVEPVSGKITKIDPDEIIKSRYLQIERASKAKRIGILVSTKIGQYRLSLAKAIRKQINDHGISSYIILMNEITPQKLENLNFDAYVNTACPRISMDDTGLYEKPVLTPQEMEMALGTRKFYPYMVDRINFVDEPGKDL